MVDERSASRGRAGMVFAVYLFVSLLLYGSPVLTHLSTRFVGEGSGDSKLYVWDLAWWPHALVSGLNPFHPTVVWTPSGVNMAWVTGLPGPALAMAPVTGLFGGVVASNILSILAPALGAWAAFLLCREVTGRPWAALAGGYLFGFSTYEVGQMHGHVNLFLTFPVPLAAYLVVRFANGTLSRRRFVWLLAAALVAEFSISTEVFATMTFFGAAAMIGALAFVPELRVRARELLTPIALAYGLAAVPLAPYLWYATVSVPPALARGVAGTSVDLLSFVAPRIGTLVGGPSLASFTQAFRANVSEDGAYLTPVLLVLLAFIFAAAWRERVTRLLFGFTGAAALLALGRTLTIRGHRTIPLPWWFFERIPILKDALPERFTMYMWLGIAVIVARWLARREPGARRIAWRVVAPWAAVGVTAVLLLPNVLLSNLHRPIDVPAFFADGLYRRYFTPGESVLVIRAPADEGDEMLWQQGTGFAFRMPQGHTGPEPVAFAQDPIWQKMNDGQPFGVTAGQLQGWLRAHEVGAILVTQTIGPRWRALLTVVAGSQPTQVGGIVLYRPPGGATGF